MAGPVREAVKPSDVIEGDPNVWFTTAAVRPLWSRNRIKARLKIKLKQN